MRLHSVAQGHVKITESSSVDNDTIHSKTIVLDKLCTFI